MLDFLGVMSLSNYLLTYTAGAASAVAGSWIASKFHVYDKARGEHHEEIKQAILEPIRGLLRDGYSFANVSIGWGQRSRDAQNDPNAHGPLVCLVDPSRTCDAFDTALLYDTKTRHYIDLFASWERFKTSWNNHLADRSEWLELMSRQILAHTDLPELTSAIGQFPFVNSLQLAHLIYRRIVESSADTLKIVLDQPYALLVDNDMRAQKYGQGKQDQLQSVRDRVISMLVSERGRAERLTADLAVLQRDKRVLEMRFSDALMAKMLPKRCPAVSFRAMLFQI